jgi:hypothetical protein
MTIKERHSHGTIITTDSNASHAKAQNHKKPVPDGNQQHDEQFYARVAKKAYELFERRGGEHGHDVGDWLEAERLVMEESRRAS